MPTPALKEQLATVYTGQALYAALHYSDPGTTGLNEISGVTRMPLVWTGGAVDGSAVATPVTFEVPAADVTHIGIWSAVTGGTFLDSILCVTSFANPGSYTMTLNYVQS